jgi:hypothetical protein
LSTLDTAFAARLSVPDKMLEWVVLGPFDEYPQDEVNCEVATTRLRKLAGPDNVCTVERGARSYVLVNNQHRDAVALAERLASEIEDGDCLDEALYWDRMCQMVDAYWQDITFSSRVCMCSDAGISLAGALQKRPPDDVREQIEQYVMEMC